MSSRSGGPRRPVVVVVGAGFAGLEAAWELSRHAVDVVILDQSNHHLFQPLLYQVATAVLSPADIAFPIRRVFRRRRNVTVFRAAVVDLDVAKSAVIHEDGTRTRYDYLVLAAGASQSYFGNDSWEAFAPGMKTLEDAARIRGRVLQAFEDAEAEEDAAAREAHLTFVIVGGGPTGVELAGAIKELAVDAMARDFRHFEAAQARVMLVELQERLLPAMSIASSDAARDQLRRLGIEVRLKTRVTEVDCHGVRLEAAGTEERIRADTVLWAAGVTANPLGRALGVACDSVGRVLVNADLTVPGHDNVYVVGDLASATCSATGRPVPGVCPAAIQMGRHAAKSIIQDVRARSGARRSPRSAFVYRDKGSLATIGRAKAVADLGGRHFRGLIAWFLWSFVHIFFLIGFRNRVFVSLSWMITYLLYTKGSRIILGDPKSRVVRRVSDPAEFA